MDLYYAIKSLFPAAEVNHDFVLRDDANGKGPYIKKWNIDAPQPTDEELAAAWAAYEAEREARENEPKPETDSEKIVRIEVEKQELHAQVSQMNDNFAAFMDFYFTKFPDQA